jgi:quercetin dioxygenase-like cupin family protein
MEGPDGDRAVEEFTIGSIAIRFVLDGSAAGGRVSIFEFDVPPGASFPIPHRHDGYDETIYGLEGTMTWTVGDSATDVGPGDALFIPRGAPHRYRNTSQATIRELAIVTPGVLGPGYFRELEAVVESRDPHAIEAVMRRHGVTPLA